MTKCAHSRSWLCIPPLILLALDATLTLLGQPEAYWSGDYAHVKELNPAAWFLMGWHPVLFLAVVILIGGLITAVIFLLPRGHAYMLSLIASFLSAAGASSWLVEYGVVGWVLVLLLFWSAERVVVVESRREASELAHLNVICQQGQPADLENGMLS